MPYIEENQRESLLGEYLGNLVDSTSLDAGKLNYIISSLLWSYFKKSPSYQRINDVVGILECAKLEFYRRQASTYEDGKIKENGDLTL